MTTDDLENDKRAPAPLGLPFGKLFFGYTVVPYKEPDAPAAISSEEPSVSIHSQVLLYAHLTVKPTEHILFWWWADVSREFAPRNILSRTFTSSAASRKAQDSLG